VHGAKQLGLTGIDFGDHTSKLFRDVMIKSVEPYGTWRHGPTAGGLAATRSYTVPELGTTAVAAIV